MRRWINKGADIIWPRRLGAAHALSRRKVSSVLFVCKGNICRSPYAEERFRSCAPESITVASAGLSTVLGKPADPRASATAKRRGISLESHRTQPLTYKLGTDFDLIVVMEAAQYLEMVVRFPRLSLRSVLLAACTDKCVSPQRLSAQKRASLTIDDPFSGDDARFELCFNSIDKAIAGLLQRLSTGAE